MAHLRDTELAAFLDDGLTVAERRRVEAHIDICEACRAELVDISRATEHRRKNASVRPSRRWWVPTIAAAGIVAVLLVPRLSPPSDVRNDATRAPFVADGEGRRRINLVSPSDDVAVPAAGLVFTWHAVTADVYRISVLTANGDPIWSAETPDTSLALPATVAVHTGEAYFWRVDAVANGIVATTGPHRVQIAR